MTEHTRPSQDIASQLARLERPTRVVVTAGMPYANGPLHLGHIAGAQLPADIYARFMGMLIGRDKVLYVCGTDDHGSTSEVTALQRGVPVKQLIEELRAKQAETLRRYDIGHDLYAGTSRDDVFPLHKELAQLFLVKLNEHGYLEKRTSKQWYDVEAKRFLPDRLVRGKCPTPGCPNEAAYSDECDICGKQFEPSQLMNPKSAVTGTVPEMRDTTHWFLDMTKASEQMRVWIQEKQKTKKWRPSVVNAVLENVLPALRFEKAHEDAYKAAKAALPKHKVKTASQNRMVLVFDTAADRDKARAALSFETDIPDEWGHRSITRDIAWGIPLPDVDPELAGKTLYVWPDSLIAPISFSRVARKDGDDWWKDPKARIVQFLGQDNVFFYVLMQGAMWIGSGLGYQLTDVVGCAHLMVNGSKMSKQRGNFFTGDQLLDEKGHSADQVRYYLATLDLSEKPSDFEEKRLAERNDFLGGKMNAAFERPISIAHKQFGGKVPDGVLDEQVVKDTERVVQRYLKCMQTADTSNLLTEHIENYARIITGSLKKHSVHDDRTPEETRKNVLYSCFYVLRNLMIMLYPVVPATMERLRASLNLPADIWKLEELGKPLPAGHALGEKGVYFPSTKPATDDED